MRHGNRNRRRCRRRRATTEHGKADRRSSGGTVAKRLKHQIVPSR
jgi:hypothetical protein